MGDYIHLVWNWITGGSGSGYVLWRINWGYSTRDSIVYLSAATAPTTGPNEKSIDVLTLAPTTANTSKSESVNLDISDMLAEDPSTLLGDILWITFNRIGGDAQDTYNQSAVLNQMVPYYTKWSEGGHATIY